MTTARLPDAAAYALRVVWSTGTDADTSAYDRPSYLMPPGLVIDGIGRAQHRAFSPPGTPALDAALPNIDGIYSPGGTLGGFVTRGPASSVAVDWGVDVTGNADDVTGNADWVLGNGRLVKNLFTGTIDSAPQAIDNPASVQIRALGSINRLLRTKPTTILYENIATGAVVTMLLDAAGWPSDLRSIDTGAATLRYWWLAGQTDCLAALRAILGAEGVPSCAYEDGEGRLHFEDRDHRATAHRSANEMWSLYDGRPGLNPTGNDPAVLGNDPNTYGNGPPASLRLMIVPSQWTSNPDEVVATVTTTVNARVATLTQKIWEYGGPLVLTPSQVLDVDVTSSDPFKNAVTPVDATDYVVSAGSLTSVSLLSTSGQTAALRFVAGGGGATVLGVTSNGPQVRAVSLPVVSTLPITSTVTPATPSSRYEPQDYSLSMWPEIGRNDALDRVNSFARRYQPPREQMTVRVVGGDADHLYMVLTAAISDRVRIRHTRANINAAFFIESLSYDLSRGGGLNILTLNCERVTDDVPSRFGEARYGFATFTE